MSIGGSLALIALGMVLRYAIVDRMDDVNLAALGAIMIWIGIIALIVSLVLTAVDAVRVRRGRPADDRW